MTADGRELESASSPAGGGVLIAGVGILVVLIAGLSFLLPIVRSLDGEAWLRERFEVGGELPFGFVVKRAMRLADGQEVILLADPGGPPPDIVSATPASPPPAEGPKVEWTDWTKVAVGEATQAPAELAFSRYSVESSKSVLTRHFSHVRFRDIHELKGEDGEFPMDSDHLRWGEYEAAYALVRNFEKVDGVPTFHDTARVNLTLDRQATVLYVRWPSGHPGSREHVERVLEVFGPREAFGPPSEAN